MESWKGHQVAGLAQQGRQPGKQTFDPTSMNIPPISLLKGGGRTLIYF